MDTERTKTRLTPNTIWRMRKLNSESLKLYASDLLGKYDARANKLNVVGERMAQRWVVKQALFFQEICEELRQIIASGDAP